MINVQGGQIYVLVLTFCQERGQFYGKTADELGTD